MIPFGLGPQGFGRGEGKPHRVDPQCGPCFPQPAGKPWKRAEEGPCAQLQSLRCVTKAAGGIEPDDPNRLSRLKAIVENWDAQPHFPEGLKEAQ